MDIELNKKWILGCYQHYINNVEIDTNYWNKWMLGCINKFKENEKKYNSSRTETEKWCSELERILFSLNRTI